MRITAPAPAWGNTRLHFGTGPSAEEHAELVRPSMVCADLSRCPACMAMLAAAPGSPPHGRHPLGRACGHCSSGSGPRAAQGRPRRRCVRVLAARARGALFALRRSERRARGFRVWINAQDEVARGQARRGDRVREAQRGLDVDRRRAAGARRGRRAVRRARVCARAVCGSANRPESCRAHVVAPGVGVGLCSLSACGERPDMQTSCCSAASYTRVSTPVFTPHRPTCCCTACWSCTNASKSELLLSRVARTLKRLKRLGEASKRGSTG